MAERDLTPLFRPRAVAVIGAADDPTKIRGRILAQLLGCGFSGGIYPIHPKHRAIQGRTAYSSIAEAPRPVDLALIAIPAESVPDTLQACAAAAVKSALVFSSGFAEAEGGASRALQERIAAIARDTGMIVAGPNSVGMLDIMAPLVASFSPAIDLATLPALRADPMPLPALRADQAPRRIGIVSQSGGLGFALFNRGLKRRLSFSTIVNTGNEAALDACDVLAWLLEDPRTGVVLMFVEAIRRGRRFIALARRALELGKTIVVAKIGRSDAARRAAASHTASLTGSDAAYEAVFRRFGVMRADDQDEMLDIAAAAALMPPPKGKRVGIVSISGGVGGWLADTLTAQALDVPEFSAALQARIRRFLPSYGAAFNPIDITAQAIGNDHRLQAIAALEEAEEVDAIVAVSSLVGDGRLGEEKAALGAIVDRRRKPTLFYSYTLPSEQNLTHLAAIGVPCYTSLRGAALALSSLLAQETARRTLAADAAMPRAEPGRAAAALLLDAAGAMLCEYEAQAILRHYDIATAPSILAQNLSEALAAAARLGFPVALKIQSPDLPHKTESGGLALGLADAAALSAAWDPLLRRVAARAPRARLRGVLVQKMAPPGIEMIAGTVCDRDFGPLVTVGFGGVHAEVLRDIAATPLPLDAASADALLDRLRGAALFGPWRGAPARDRAALAALLVRLSRLAGDFPERILAIDLNPVLLHGEGEGVTVVDALIEQHRHDPCEEP
ncbi:MAG: acetate--CoA ligase family protein [Alphaproteobacteria bacterium]|nr:acetate--CoA ligase family protein [Alphaproteobacteria bacterium]